MRPYRAVRLSLLTSTTVSFAPTSFRQENSLDGLDEARLAASVWRTAPDVLAARRDVIESEAVRERSHLIPNPLLTGRWSTLRIGARSVGVPFGAIPSYSAELAELIEIGKRAPRQRAVQSAQLVSGLAVRGVYVRTFFAVVDTLSDQAATARMAVLESLARDSFESLRLQHARADRGDPAQLEVDRLEVEHSRLLSAFRQAEATRYAAAVGCAVLLGSSCPGFPGEAEARRFLETSGTTALGNDGAALAASPDLSALREERAQLEAELRLAQRPRIHDPVASVSFTRHQFVPGGNQASSLGVRLSIPLPVFDSGQTDSARARQRLALNETIGQNVLANARAAVTLQHRQLEALVARTRVLDEQAVPRAHSVVARTEAASRRGDLAFRTCCWPVERWRNSSSTASRSRARVAARAPTFAG